MKTDKDRFSPAVFRSISAQKTPVTECLVCCVCVLCYCCYFSFLRAERNLMAHRMEFRRPKLRECTAPSSLCLCQHLPRYRLFGQQDIGQLRKGLELYKKLCISVIK